MSSIRKVLSFPLLICVLSFLTACSTDEAGKDSKKPSKPHRVEAINAQHTEIGIKRVLNGSIQAPDTVRIHNQVSGVIVSIPKRPGDHVKKDEVLVKLDDALIKAEFEKSQALLEKAQSDLQRIEKLVPKNLASQEELSIARTELKLATAEYDIQKIQLERTQIRSPFDGLLSERFFEPGDTVVTDTHILTVFDDQHLIASTDIPEDILSQISKGDGATVKVPAADTEFQATIERIYPAVDQTTQQVTIDLTLPASSNRIFPGQFCKITLRGKSQPRLLIPSSALQYEDNSTWVYVIDENEKARQKKVITGLTFDDLVEIVQGINPGERVITKGFIGLRKGKQVATSSDEKPNKSTGNK